MSSTHISKTLLAAAGAAALMLAGTWTSHASPTQQEPEASDSCKGNSGYGGTAANATIELNNCQAAELNRMLEQNTSAPEIANAIMKWTDAPLTLAASVTGTLSTQPNLHAVCSNLDHGIRLSNNLFLLSPQTLTCTPQ